MDDEDSYRFACLRENTSLKARYSASFTWEIVDPKNRIYGFGETEHLAWRCAFLAMENERQLVWDLAERGGDDEAYLSGKTPAIVGRPNS
jgi:hypothetical protein